MNTATAIRAAGHWLGLGLIGAIAYSIAEQVPLTGLPAAVAKFDAVAITMWAAWAAGDLIGGQR